MKRWIAFVVSAALGSVALGGVAQAQTAAPSMGEPGRWYVEGVAQSAFGNVTSQSYGGEAGVTVLPQLQLFAEGGQTRNVAPSSLGASAQLIGGFLSETQTAVAYSAVEPLTFFAGGAKYLIPMASRKLQPYVLGGGGVATVKRNVHFTIGGTDVTSNLQQYGVTLGSDLSGSSTDPLLVIGGGVAWPAWQHVVVDFQYRYGRVFASGSGINVNRVGVGVGLQF